ncbi:flagellar hook-basal body complex protein FliE [Azotosporobacter soli]|uniref:flagellar hook-basal body complex protein FliE n=1 Tax=Azotosporobacter soli TaxID=3055040 RepID=UPI0031FF2FCB
MQIDAIKLIPVSVKPVSGQVTAQVETKSFGAFLTEALDDVNALQHKAAKASVDLAAGKIEDISQVTIAAEKANIAMQLTMTVRNKVLDAYQEVMRMQV